MWHTVKTYAVDFFLTLWSVFDWRNDGYSCAEESRNSKRLWYALLLTAVLLGSAVRFYILHVEPDIGRDGVYYIELATRWANGNFDDVRRGEVHWFFILPGALWCIKLLIQLGLPPLAAAVTANMLAGIALIPLMYKISSVLFDSRKAGVVAAFLTALNPVLVDYSTDVLRENFMLLSIAIMLLFTVLGFRKDSRYFCGAGFFTVAGILSRYEALEVIPLLLICLALLAVLRVYPVRKIMMQLLYFILGCIAGAVIFYFLLGIPAQYYTVNLFRRGTSLVKWIR